MTTAAEGRSSTGSGAVRASRGPRAEVSDHLPVATFEELEVASAGRAVRCRVAILSGAECRFTCSMCDLWRHSLERPTEKGRLPKQIHSALVGEPLPPAEWLKLYNGSNFFDARSVPDADLPVIADLCRSRQRVIVENHPRLIGDAVWRFRDRLVGSLEVAMGLETIHPTILPRLEKRMTIDDFAAATDRLHRESIDVRAFVLLGLPWATAEESLEWCVRSVDFARSIGVRHVSIVPTRTGNGYLDRLEREGAFERPSAALMERAFRAALGGDTPSDIPAASVVTLDLWDWHSLAGHCDRCRDRRRSRLSAMALAQHASAADIRTCECQP
ncbi:MAG: radical SAM protein [Planctomycetaceae bacterium]